MNINAIIGALKSPKTPARLKEGLLRKFGTQLSAAGYKGMSGLMTTVKTNPLKFSDGMSFNTEGPLRVITKSDGLYVVGNGMLIPVNDAKEANELIAKMKIKKNPPYGYGTHDDDNNPHKPKGHAHFTNPDVWVTEGPKGTYTIDYPAKKYTGVIKGLSKTNAFLKPAKVAGLTISWSTM
jgi:hypothetical protein